MRYGVNLLFEYGVDGRRAARPLCEKRIVVIEARSPKDAVRKAKQYGRRQQLSYKTADGQRFRIRFLGLVDVLDLENAAADEVYYSLFRTSDPERHLRSNANLAVFRAGPKTIRSAWWAAPPNLHARLNDVPAMATAVSNKPLERPGVSPRADVAPASAGRSAPIR
jgi:hypothetical protein